MAGPQRPNVSSPVAVGRESELDSMRTVLEQLRDGQGRVVVVGGEAGIGKTRLIDDSLVAAGDSIRVMRGNCLVLGSAIPYLPFAEMLRHLIRDLSGHSIATLIGPARSELARLMPELAVPGASTSNGAPRPRLNGEIDRLRLYEALLRVAERIAADKPTAFVIEDIQWIDPASLELLSFLAHALDHNGHASLIISVRSEAIEDGGPVLTFLADLERAATVERLELQPLSADATRRQVAAILGERPSDTLVARIHGLADGNPLFAEELVAASSDGSGPGDALPPKLRDLVAARMAGLSDDSLAVLRVTAAAGRTIDDGLLASTTGLDEQRVESAIRDALNEHVLVLGNDPDRPSYGFRHEIMRTVVASQLLPAESARIHAAYAEALSAEPVERQNASEIALHWDGSGETTRALAAHVRAGQEAADAYAFEQAHDHYERALVLWAEVPDAETVAGRTWPWIAERAATTAGKAGQLDRAIELTREIIEAHDEADREIYELAR
ncbi:MAG: AAA family ATPase, partial [Chloroflexota bacterium]